MLAKILTRSLTRSLTKTLVKSLGSVLEMPSGASAAWGVTSLFKSYSGAAVRIRANGGVNNGLELDFTFAEYANGDIDTWVGAGIAEIQTWYDASGNGVDLTPVGSARPVAQTGEGIAFNGADALTNASLNMVGSTGLTVVVAGKFRDNVNLESVVEHSANGASGSGFGIFTNNNIAGRPDQTLGTGHPNGTFRNARYPFNGDVPVTFVSSAVWIDGSNDISMMINGGSVGVVDILNTAVFNVATHLIDNPIFVGARNGSSLFLDADLYGVLIYPRVLNSDELASAHTILGSVCGALIVSPSMKEITINASVFDDTRAPIDKITHFETSPFATLPLDTIGTILEIGIFVDDYIRTFSSALELGLWINGSYYAPIWSGNQGSGDITDILYFFLPAGVKQVKIAAGMQSFSSGLPKGVFITSLKVNDFAASIPAIPITSRVLIYGDSIATGYNAGYGGHLTKECWAMKLRAIGHQIAVEAHGFRTLKDDAANAGEVTAFVDLLETYAPSTIILAIGTNDYGLEPWSAASFGSAYADILDEIDTDLNGVPVLCFSPTIRTSEVANSFGDTTQDYRDAISIAASSRAWATYVDGASMILVGDLFDSVHPDEVGHGKISVAIDLLLDNPPI